MSDRKRNLIQDARFPASRVLPFATAAFAIAIFIADTVTNVEIAFSVFYVLIVVIASRFCESSGVVLVTGGCVALTLLSYFISPPGGTLIGGIVNTAISIGAIVLTAALVLRDQAEQSKRKKSEEALHQLEREIAHMNRLSIMGELAASLTHEITQPIASARNNARAALNFLDKEPPALGEVGEALGCVVGDADRAGDIVDRIRDHVKKAPPRKGRFDLNEAINEVIVCARSAITENGVSVQIRLTEGLFPVQGDRVQLQQVFLNLVLNAVEAMGSTEEGARELMITTEQTETGGALVAVRDSGPGIAPEHLERVFDAFYTTKSSGTGMGLSICRSIIEAHGGRLWAEANEPRGAVFQFTLPGPIA